MSDAGGKVPHPIPYQGSKRRLAPVILDRLPEQIHTLYEPFAGSAAITLGAARRDLARRYVLGDKLAPLAELWRCIVAAPAQLADDYQRLWDEQDADPRGHYLEVRARFNDTHEPPLLLYLLARCVKNAVRFNARGQFNQSADHRRRGMHPSRMRSELAGASTLLAGRCDVAAGDYSTLLARATPDDFVYLDPPYQGVSDGRDSRYVEQLDYDRFVAELAQLRSRGVPFAVSFDGSTGDRIYGRPLPDELDLERVLLRAGRSSQATLAGRSQQTIESLYLARGRSQLINRDAESFQ